MEPADRWALTPTARRAARRRRQRAARRLLDAARRLVALLTALQFVAACCGAQPATSRSFRPWCGRASTAASNRPCGPATRWHHHPVLGRLRRQPRQRRRLRQHRRPGDLAVPRRHPARQGRRRGERDRAGEEGRLPAWCTRRPAPPRPPSPTRPTRAPSGRSPPRRPGTATTASNSHSSSWTTPCRHATTARQQPTPPCSSLHCTCKAAANAALNTRKVELSYDDGATWTTARLSGRGNGKVSLPLHAPASARSTHAARPGR